MLIVWLRRITVDMSVEWMGRTPTLRDAASFDGNRRRHSIDSVVNQASKRCSVDGTASPSVSIGYSAAMCPSLRTSAL